MPELKRGDLAIQTILCRSPLGMRITVKSHPGVEHFMANALYPGQNEPLVEPLGVYGRAWLPKEGELNLYQIPSALQGVFNTGRFRYRLDRPGQPLMMPDPDGSQIINASFFRLVGTEKELGVTFQIPGVHEDTETILLTDAYQAVAANFYQKFLHPIEIQLNAVVR